MIARFTRIKPYSRLARIVGLSWARRGWSRGWQAEEMTLQSVWTT